MALLSLVLLTGWTYLVVRLFGARATITDRTLLVYLALGSLLSMAVVPFVDALFVPYGQTNAVLGVFVALGRSLVLLLPIMVPFLLQRRFRYTSVADAFMLAFMIGLGFDQFGAILVASTAASPVPGLTFFPPWQLTTDRFTVAGSGYYLGLIAISFAAALRFLPHVWMGMVVGSLVFLLASLEQAAIALRAAGNPLDGYLRITMNGALTAWVALVALVFLSILEDRWARRALRNASVLGPSPIEEWKLRLGALARGKLGEYTRLTRLFGLERQAQLVAGELTARPGDVALGLASLDIEDRVSELASGTAAGEPPPPPAFGLPIWRQRAVAIAVPWVLLALIVVVLPVLPAPMTGALWSFPLLSVDLRVPPVSVLGLALALLILWRFIVSAGRPRAESEPDDVLQFAGEQAILQAALAAVLLLTFNLDNQYLYPFYNLIAQYTRFGLPRLDAPQVQTLLLLFAAALTGLTLLRSAQWQRAPILERRAAAVSHVIQLALMLFLTLLVAGVYDPVLAAFHATFGTALFGAFGSNGNTGAAIILVVVIAVIAAVVARPVRALGAALQRFLAGPEPA